MEFFQTSREFIRDSTLVDGCHVLFCGGERKVLHTKGRFIIDDWMEFAASARTASIVKRLSEVSRKFSEIDCEKSCDSPLTAVLSPCP